MQTRQMEAALQAACPVLDFNGRPNITLEQYSTSPHLAAQMLTYIESEYGSISNQVVSDFGSGCGVLSVGCALLDAAAVFAFDIDEKCLALTETHCGNAGFQGLELVRAYIPTGLPRRKVFDTVVMNPPFGTRNAGIDVAFVDSAVNVAAEVYSLHKTSTRKFLQKKEREMDCEVLATLRFDLPKTYKMHKQKSVDVEVDLWRFSKRE